MGGFRAGLSGGGGEVGDVDVGGLPVDVGRLSDDVRACLIFLIEHQREWEPMIMVAKGGRTGHGIVRTPVTLIARVNREGQS